MEPGRLKEMLIAALGHAIEVSEQATADLIRAIGITDEELDELGYDEKNFPAMHGLE